MAYRGQDMTLEACKSTCDSSATSQNSQRSPVCSAVLYDTGMDGTNCYFFTKQDFVNTPKVSCQINDMGKRRQTWFIERNSEYNFEEGKIKIKICFN